jgi:hypothetical protein
MISGKTRIWRKWHLIFVMVILVGVFSFSSAGLWKGGLAAPGEPVPLVKIELDDISDVRELHDQGISVYFQFSNPQGGMMMLLPADPSVQEVLSRQGYRYDVVDPDSRQASYYLIQGREAELSEALLLATVLLRDGDQVFVRMDPADLPQMTSTGVRFMPLILHPLAYAEPSQIETISQTQTVAANPLIQRMVDKVSQDTLYQYVGNLSGEWSVSVNGEPYQFYTRNTWEYQPITKATRFGYEHFASLGILADYHYYLLSGLERRNVLAQQTGLSQPNRIFMLIAHLDSTSNAPATSAPGADDNASGSAAVMHIAEILKQYPFGCSLRYTLFTGEEQGLYGSWAYAQRLRTQGVNVVAVLNLDMLAYSPAGSTHEIELHTRSSNETDLELAGLFKDVASAYQLNLSPVILNDGLSFSDHYPFWENGFPGILAIEDWAQHTPFYHTTGDRLSTLDMPYYTEFTKAALATYAHVGCLLEGDVAGVVREAGTEVPIAGAEVVVQSANYDPWYTSTSADGSYQLPLYIGDYQITVSAPGYLGPISANIHINHDSLTTQNLELQLPFSFTYLPLIVTSEP